MGLHVFFEVAIGLHSLHVHLVLFLHEVIGKRGGVLAIAPLDVVRNVPLLGELCGDGYGLIVDGLHPRSGVAFEDDIASTRIVAIADEHTLFGLVSPVGLDLVVVICRDDVLFADLAAGRGIDL